MVARGVVHIFSDCRIRQEEASQHMNPQEELITAQRERINALKDLLTCYRLGVRPNKKVLSAIDETKMRLIKLGETDV